MNDDFVTQALAQARELQQRVTETLLKGQEHAKPYLEQSMKHAEALRETLLLQARRSADVTHEQTNKALDELNAAMKAGSEAMHAQSAAAAPLISEFVKQARDAAEQVTKIFGKGR